MADSVEGPLSCDVEVDETYVGGKPRYKGNNKRGRGTKKTPVLAFVERSRRVKTMPAPNVTGNTLKAAIRESVAADARIITDENSAYTGIGSDYVGGHETVTHSARGYVRGDVHSNTIEGCFSIVKRGLNRIYHSVSKGLLHRYLAEYEFRYDHRDLSDEDRTIAAIKAAQGNRLMYVVPIDGGQHVN
jgi:transposase-like protein